MYGVTQSESFHLLNAATLQFGLTETERNRIIRTYVRNSYASNIDQVTAAILNEYTVRKKLVCSSNSCHFSAGRLNIIRVALIAVAAPR